MFVFNVVLQSTPVQLTPEFKMINAHFRNTLLSAVLVAAIAGPVMAHGPKKHGDENTAAAVEDAEQMPWGIAGSPDKVDRTIEVSMLDKMRFEPALMKVKTGETIRFVVRNDGKVLHEFVIGTQDANDTHAALMVKFPGMEHDAPYMAHVEPGKTGEIVWTFNEPGEFKFACLIAGHYQAGMVGAVTVSAK